MTQFYSRNDVNYSGDVYSIPFDYIDKKEVKVYIDDELWTKWHFLAKHQLTLDEVPEDIRYSNIISVRRETDIEEKVVTYDNNSLLNKENLNKSQDQLLFAVQEIYDNNIQNNIDIRAEVDEKVERVSEAVEKLDIIDASVETSVQKAQEATEQAQIATEKAEIATEKAEATLQTYETAMNDIDNLLADCIDDLTSLDATIKKDADAIINRVGFNMFDTVIKDRVLTYEESKGLELQGTYVYKEAVAGSRYGYPNFYNKVVEEFENSTIKVVNADIVGSPTINKGVISGFSANDYLQMKSYPTNVSSFEMHFEVVSPEGEDSQVFFGQSTKNRLTPQLGCNSQVLSFIASATGESWDTGLSVPVSPNTKYSVTVSWNGSTVSGFVTDSNGVVTNMTPYSNYTDNLISLNWVEPARIGLDIGISVFQGSVDLNKSYININGSRWWTGGLIYENANKHLFYDISQKNKIDDVYNADGVAWFYGVDDENERVFLPRQNLLNITDKSILPVAGNGMTLGLSNPTTGNTGFRLLNSYFTGSNPTYGQPAGTVDKGNTGITEGYSFGVTTDSSKSGIESRLTDFKEENKYLYICVGNIESQSSITDVVDVTTTENDTVPLFTGQYFDFTPNNLSWLKAGEQANNAGIYATCYNELVNVLNGETKYGDLKVVNTADMIAGIDYSEYWKVNQGEMTFTTPSKISYLPINADTAPVVGNGMSLGLQGGTDGLLYGGISGRSNDGIIVGYQEFYGTDLGTNLSSGTKINDKSGHISLGVTTDPTKSGLIADLAGAKSQTSQLYFKVANAVQNLELLDVGEVMEALADKISRQECKAYIVETYVNGTSGYRVWSDKYCEQWGLSSYPATVTLLKNYKDTNWNIVATIATNSTKAQYENITCIDKTVSSFYLDQAGRGVSNSAYWRACGYIA